MPPVPGAVPAPAIDALDAEELRRLDAYWRAANYLSVGQIYLLDNPLLREPLAARARQAAAARALGHDAGAELRLRAPEPADPRARPRRALRRPGPGTAAPGWWPTPTSRAPTPRSTRTSAATRRACAGCSASSRSRAGSRATSRPRRPARSTRAASWATRWCTPTARRSTTRTCSCAASIGDGEAETGPLAASWHSNKFLNPARDGAVLPVLHLNGYKIANPTVLARIPERELRALLEGYGYAPRFVEGAEPEAMHQLMAATLDEVADEIAAIQARARATARPTRPAWPMIVLRTPEGLDRAQGRRRAARRGLVPLAPGAAREPRHQPRAPRAAGGRGCAPTAPRSSSTPTARCAPSSPPLAPRGERRMGANPHANGGAAHARPRAAGLPRLRGRRARAGAARPARPRACSAASCATSCAPTRDDVPPLRPRRDGVEPARRGLRGHRPRVGGRDPARPTTTSRPTAA